MNQNDHHLDALLGELARETRGLDPPAELEARVMRAWGDRAPARAVPSVSRPWLRWAIAGGSLAASLVCGALLWPRSGDRLAPAGDPVAQIPASPDAYLQWLDDDPASLQVVRLRVTRDALGAMGVATASYGEGDMVEIELVVGPDGARRAARLVPATAQEDF